MYSALILVMIGQIVGFQKWKEIGNWGSLCAWNKIVE